MKYILTIILSLQAFAIQSTGNYSLSSYDAINIIKNYDNKILNYIEQQRVEYNSLVAIFYKTQKEGICSQCKPRYKIAIFDMVNKNKYLGYLDEIVKWSFQADVFPLAQFVPAGTNRIPILFFIEGGGWSDSGNYYSILYAYAFIKNKITNVITHRYEGYNSGNRGGIRCSYSTIYYGIDKYNFSSFNIETTTIIPMQFDDKIACYSNQIMIDRYSWDEVSNIYIKQDTITNNTTNCMESDEFWQKYYFQK